MKMTPKIPTLEDVERLREMADDYKVAPSDRTKLYKAAAELTRLRAEVGRLEKENTYLRGIVQRNPEWKCTYGMKIETMAQCPSGFPGCGCADDLMLSQDEAFHNIAELISTARTSERERCAKIAESYPSLTGVPFAIAKEIRASAIAEEGKTDG